MQARTNPDRAAWQRRHQEALHTSSYLTTVYYEMYRPMAADAPAKKVVRVLKKAGITPLLLGTHGVGGYRSEPRATQDVDLLIRKKDHAKAIRAIKAAYPKLEMQDESVVTRFLDPKTGKSL